MAMCTVYTNVVQGKEEQNSFLKEMSQALNESTGKPEALCMVGLCDDLELALSQFGQNAICVDLVIMGADDPFRTEKIVQFMTYKLGALFPDVLPSQILIKCSYTTREYLGYNDAMF